MAPKMGTAYWRVLLIDVLHQNRMVRTPAGSRQKRDRSPSESSLRSAPAGLLPASARAARLSLALRGLLVQQELTAAHPQARISEQHETTGEQRREVLSLQLLRSQCYMILWSPTVCVAVRAYFGVTLVCTVPVRRRQFAEEGRIRFAVAAKTYRV